MGLQYVPQLHTRAAALGAPTFPGPSVEGDPPSPTVRRVGAGVLWTLAVLTGSAAVTLGYVVEGLRGVVLAATIFGAYSLLGWWPYFAARHYRRRAHED